MCNEKNDGFTDVDVTYNGITKTYEQWDTYLGYKPGTMKRRLLINKWDVKRAMTTSVGNHATAGRCGAKRSPWRYGSNFINQAAK